MGRRFSEGHQSQEGASLENPQRLGPDLEVQHEHWSEEEIFRRYGVRAGR